MKSEMNGAKIIHENSSRKTSGMKKKIIWHIFFISNFLFPSLGFFFSHVSDRVKDVFQNKKLTNIVRSLSTFYDRQNRKKSFDF